MSLRTAMLALVVLAATAAVGETPPEPTLKDLGRAPPEIRQGERVQPDANRARELYRAAARREIAAVQVAAAVQRYMADLVYATRTPGRYAQRLDRWIDVGASPRASLALDKCSRTYAWLNGRDYVDPGDVRAVVHDVLRHRLMLSYEAQGEGVAANQVIDAVVEHVALP